MTPHDRTTDSLRELAQQYALGTLADAERRDFERHLADGCAVCREAVRAELALAADVALATPPRAARPELKQRLLQHLRDARGAGGTPAPADAPKTGANAKTKVQTWKDWEHAGPVDRFLPREEGTFEATGSPGVFVRQLFVDRKQRSATMLIRMDAGASYPGHRHGGLEECYVLEGDLHHDDRVMRAGDFEVVSEGSRHGRQWTEGGCLLLIRSSLDDELTE
jgi:quercetin dioxygenase-like cupin family protein